MVSPAGTTTLPTLASLAPGPPRTYLDVLDPNTSSEGRGRGWREWGRGAVPAWLTTGSPGWGTENTWFWGKSSLSRENAPKCSQNGGTPKNARFFPICALYSSHSPWAEKSGSHLQPADQPQVAGESGFFPPVSCRSCMRCTLGDRGVPPMDGVSQSEGGGLSQYLTPHNTNQGAHVLIGR